MYFEDISKKIPTVVNKDEIKDSITFPEGGTVKYLLCEENAGCKYANMGLLSAEPGKGFPWHFHPKETGEEEFLFILKGKGTLYYRQSGKKYEINLKEKDSIFSGNLMHCIKNTGNETLLIYFSIAPLPEKTVYGLENEKNILNSDTLEPPKKICFEDVEEKILFPKGGAINRDLLFPNTVGCKKARMGSYLARKGKGSQWHTHPFETGEEDLFYIVSGKGIMVYQKDGQEYSFEFKEGDAIHSHHLPNYTKNIFDEDLFIIFTGAPLPATTIIHNERP